MRFLIYWASFLPLILMLLFTCTMASRSGVAHSSQTSLPLSDSDKLTINADFMVKEKAWRRDALERFPGDSWSQNDHFGNLESAEVMRLSQIYRQTPEKMIRVLNEGMKLQGELQSSRPLQAVPCMPRPFYD